MKVYTAIDLRIPLDRVPALAQRIEAAGYDHITVPEAVHDGFLVALLALEHTTRIKVTTNVILAFPRSPMIVAHAAWDLAKVSRGRLELGLGSQVKGNIVGRFSTAWAPPVPRMREYIQSIRAIWDCWQNATPLDFHGEHYTFTRQQPFFNPGPMDFYPVPIFLGAVNRNMTRLAGEQADGMITHPTNSDPRYLRDVTLPSLQAGGRKTGRSLDGFELGAGGFIATGVTSGDVARAKESMVQTMGFLYSTPAYWPTLDLNGWGEIGRRLHAMTREGRWQDLAAQVTPEMIDRLAVIGTYDEIAEKLKERYGGIATRVSLPLPADPADDWRIAKVIEQLKS